MNHRLIKLRCFMKTKTRRITEVLGSGWMFAATLAVFAFEGSWLALTSRFPMAFDEAFHFGLIQFFSHRLDPIITYQAGDTYKYGALIQNPSIFYHYLMSFPYRLINIFVHTTEMQVVCMRLLNVSLAIVSLIIMRKLLRLLGMSRPLANVMVLAVAFTPLFTVLSSQINYDNLLILAVTGSFYLVVSFGKRLAAGRFDTDKLLWLLCLCLFASLIKYAFLPVFVAIALVVAWQVLAYRRRPKTLLKSAKEGFSRISGPLKIMLVTLLIAGSSLFIRFYGVNVVKYHNPYPQCDQVLNVPDCMHYYAWNNFYQAEQYNRQHHVEADKGASGLAGYTAYWFELSNGELFGATFPYLGDLYGSEIFFLIVTLLAGGMLIVTLRNIRKLFRAQPDLLILLFISAVYVLFLFAKNYHDYVRTGEAMGIHGRYLLPVLLCGYVILAAGTKTALAGLPKWSQVIKIALALTVIVSFLLYGGFRPYTTYVTPRYGHLSPSNAFHLLDLPGPISSKK